MNAFSAILLAWPFYLAVKGELVTYIKLAKANSTATAAAAPVSGANAQATPAQGATP